MRKKFASVMDAMMDENWSSAMLARLGIIYNASESRASRSSGERRILGIAVTVLLEVWPGRHRRI
jgi:hypothetical protein